LNLTSGLEKARRLNIKSHRSEHLPEWFKVRVHSGEQFRKIRRMCKERGLNTVCVSAGCPNIWECWNSGTATFMILGHACTRDCTFCRVPGAKSPARVDPEEPRKVAEMIERLELSWAVVTSVTRDDLADGGAGAFAECVRSIHRARSRCGVEILIPDFAGNTRALDTVISSSPQVIAHNVETVPRLYATVRPQADYLRSLKILEYVAEKSEGNFMVKSSLMVGLGETDSEIRAVIGDLARCGCRVMTIGQYLPPSKKHHPVARYYTPEEFDLLAETARRAGIRQVAAGPLVRSSYQAHRLAVGLEA